MQLQYCLHSTGMRIACGKHSSGSLPGGIPAGAVNRSLFSTTDFWHQKNTDYNNSPFHISQCFVLKLSDLQSVNVGLFDQYFRLTGK